MNQQQQMMQQVKRMQAEMARAQEELAGTVVTGTAAGGLVTIEMSCEFVTKSVKIAKDAVDPEELETLEDLVLVALNDVVAKVQETSSKRMGSVTGGLKIPGLM